MLPGVGVYSSLSSRNEAKFLGKCLFSFPFPIKAVQTDNGSEFLKEFERLCQDMNIPHYFIYPRQSKQNSYVERSHGSDEQEFYRWGNVWHNPEKMDEVLTGWQNIWNGFGTPSSVKLQNPYAVFRRIKGQKFTNSRYHYFTGLGGYYVAELGQCC